MRRPGARGRRTAVVTGGSSGIGAATVDLFSSRGWNVVACARSHDALAEIARRCAGRAGRVVTVTADVSDEDAVARVARVAIDELGGFDAWVNNAALLAYGSFEQLPVRVFRRVVDVNLFGYVNGMRCALEHFRARGGGVVVNVSSQLGKFASPYVGAYVTSKFAVQGLSETVRLELGPRSPIRVAVVLPGGVDTPIYRRSANYSGARASPSYNLQDPRRVARAIWKCVRRPRREIVVGPSTRPLAFLHAIAPGAYERLGARFGESVQLSRDPAPPSDGNAFVPSDLMRE